MVLNLPTELTTWRMSGRFFRRDIRRKIAKFFTTISRGAGQTSRGCQAITWTAHLLTRQRILTFHCCLRSIKSVKTSTEPWTPMSNTSLSSIARSVLFYFSNGFFFFLKYKVIITNKQKKCFCFQDGQRTSSTVACALLLYSGAFSTVDEVISLLTTRRCQPPDLHPSELRIVSYIGNITRGIAPHSRPLVLRSLLIQPVPLFTRAKDGCRPYIDVYSNGSLVFSSKRPEYEEMKLFSVNEGRVCIVLSNATVLGDVSVMIYHARQQLGRVIGIKIASFYFHTGYVSRADKQAAMTFEGNELDDAPEIGGKFRAVLNYALAEDSGKGKVSAPWETEAATLNPEPLFGSTLEMEETFEHFRTNKPQVAAVVAGTTSVDKEMIISSNNGAASGQEAEEEARAVLESETPLIEQEPEEEVEIQNQHYQTESSEAKFAEADLLNLGGGASETTSTAAAAAASSAQPTPTIATTAGMDDIFSNIASSQNQNDLLGGFASSGGTSSDFFFRQEKSSPAAAANANSSQDLFGSNPTSSSSWQNTGGGGSGSGHSDFFDPLGQSGANNDLFNWATSQSGSTPKSGAEEGFPRNASVPNFAPQANNDPFQNLSSTLGSTLTSSWNGTPREATTPQSSSPATASTPTHAAAPKLPKATNDGNDASKAKSGDIFEDLLGSQGYNFTSRKTESSPKTINQMRIVDAAKTMDPDRLKIAEWTEGKKGNLRALLCSMHTILWDDCKWNKCEMHQLVTAADVKKAYRKACLAVHPDKVLLFFFLIKNPLFLFFIKLHLFSHFFSKLEPITKQWPSSCLWS